MNTKNKLPLMYHPTNVLFLDDEPVFLNRICHAIDQSIPYTKIGHPLDAIDYLCKHTYQSDFFAALTTHRNFNQTDPLEGVENFDVNFAMLSNELDVSDRFEKIAVVFVDQLMPTMKGIDFCKKIREKNLLVKLILLTSNAEKDEVIDAFNQGVIDAYVAKDHPQLVETINEHVIRYAWNQFLDFSSNLLGFISHLVKPLYDENFLKFFNEILKTESFVEFYLLDSSCSFLLLTNQGKAKKLFFYTPADFEDCYELAHSARAPYHVLQSIQDKKKFPLTENDKNYLQLAGHDWIKFMHDCNKVPGVDMYYVLVDKSPMDAFSFKRYFDTVWK